MASENLLRVFIASPGDLQGERKAAFEIAERINRRIGRVLGWRIDLLGWEDTRPGIGRPQELINQDVDACELFVGLLWKRWGQESGEYSSGFEEEFRRAKARRDDSSVPDMWLFFKRLDPDLLRDPGEQLQKVTAFRAEQIEARELLFKEFGDEQEWGELLHDYLAEYLLERSRRQVDSLENRTAGQATPPTSDQNEQATLGGQVDELVGALEEIVGTIRGTAGDVDSPNKVAMLRTSLLGISWVARTTTDQFIPEHLLQTIYRSRASIDPTAPERDLIFRTLMARRQFAAGWFWFRDRSVGQVTSALLQVATSDRQEEARAGAARELVQGGWHLPADADARRLATELLSDSALAVREVGLELVTQRSDDWKDEVLAAAAETTDGDLRDKAYRELFRTRAQRSGDDAWRELLDWEGALPDGAIDASKEVAAGASSELLDAGLSNETPSLRVAAMEELESRRALDLETVQHLISRDPSSEVRWAALKIALDHHDWDVSEQDLVSVREALSPFEVDQDEVNAVVLRFMSELSDEELEEKISWLQLSGPQAYRAWIELSAAERKTIARKDIEEGFGRIRTQTLAEQPAKVREAVEVALEELDDGIRNRFLREGLMALSVDPAAEDLSLARVYIADEAHEVQVAAIQTLKAAGTDQDGFDLAGLALRDRRVNEVAAETAIVLAPGPDGAAAVLRDSAVDALVLLAIDEIVRSTENDLRTSLADFLHNSSHQVREYAVRILIAACDKPELDEILHNYLGSETYYYSVVARLDRAAYAPNAEPTDTAEE